MIPKLTHDSVIVKRLLRKRELLRAGDPHHSEIKTLLLILGGAMRGVYGAGTVQAFHDLGLSDVFDDVIGISTGAAIGSYFLAGKTQTDIGSSIYYEECTQGKFINFKRAQRILDIDYLGTVFRAGPKVLDQKAVIHARSNMWYGVTDVRTGDFELIAERESRPDIAQAIMASAALPIAYNKSVILNDRAYVDGGVSRRFPYRIVLEHFHPTDVVVIVNNIPGFLRPPFGSDSLAVLAPMFLRGKPDLRRALAQRNIVTMDDLRVARSAHTHVGGIYAQDATVRDFTIDPVVLRAAMSGAREHTLKLFT